MAITDPTHFDEGTDPAVKRVLEEARKNRTRIRVTYGDRETGRDWLEEHDIMGYVGRSAGRKPILILCHNSRSRGGGGLLTACILRIETTSGHRLLYLHPAYRLPNLTAGPGDLPDKPEYTATVYRDGEPWARFRTMQQARNWIAFMTHQRNRP